MAQYDVIIVGAGPAGMTAAIYAARADMKVLTPDSTEEQIAQFVEEEYIEDERERLIRKALQEGKSIYYGCVSFEDCEYSYSDAFETLWANLEKCTPENFTMIDGDLSY